MYHHSPFDDLQNLFLDGEGLQVRTDHTREAYWDEAGHDVDAMCWFALGFSPRDAARFRAMGMDEDEALSWGLSPSLVERFRALGFTKREARKWALTPIWPDHAFHWRHAGYSPAEALYVIDLSDSAAAALAWTLTGLDPWEAIHRAKGGEKAGPLLAESHRRQT